MELLLEARPVAARTGRRRVTDAPRESGRVGLVDAPTTRRGVEDDGPDGTTVWSVPDLDVR